jgi:hypothetical protein
MLNRGKPITTAAIAALAGACAATAVAAPGAHDQRRAVKLELIERPGERLERSIDVHNRRQRMLRKRREERRSEREADFASPSTYGVSEGTLEAIASCESGGDPTAVSADGTYRGKYQFDTSTWAAMGGSGDPAAASEAEQDMRAAMLYSQSGSSPWPVCGA